TQHVASRQFAAVSAADNPGCLKTHTFAKCRKYNSQISNQASGCMCRPLCGRVQSWDSGLRMRRREFITLLGGARAALSVTALAQQSGKLIRLGFLGPTLNNPATIVPYEAFRTALAEGGFREGQNLVIDYQSVDDPRGPFVVAAELTRSRPDLIVTSRPEASLQAVMGVSGFIPVVMIAINF